MGKVKEQKPIGRIWLVQRLNKVICSKGDSPLAKLVNANPFAFGGGLLHGGLSDKAFDLLSQIFRFDYMGAAEFEWGAVPKALQHIAKNRKQYIAYTLDVRTRNKNTGTVYVICPEENKGYISDWIKKKAYDEYGKSGRGTKEAVLLDSVLDGVEYSRDLKGWLELDTGFFFFVDKDMFNQVCQLFEIKKNEVPA